MLKRVKGFGGGMKVCLFDYKKSFDLYFKEGQFSYNQVVQKFIKGCDIGFSVL